MSCMRWPLISPQNTVYAKMCFVFFSRFLPLVKLDWGWGYWDYIVSEHPTFPRLNCSIL